MTFRRAYIRFKLAHLHLFIYCAFTNRCAFAAENEKVIRPFRNDSNKTIHHAERNTQEKFQEMIFQEFDNVMRQ